MEGELLKKNKLIGWSSRYFCVSKQTCSILVYKDKTKSEVSAAVELFLPSTGFAEAASLPADIALDAGGCKLTAELQKV